MGRLRKNIKKENSLFTNNDYYISNPEKYLGIWNEAIFKNDNEIHVEIGCGKGIFILQKALLNSKTNFIAIDKFGTVIFSLLNKMIPYKLKNLKLVCLCATKVDEIFSKDEINKLYLNFSDPWPKKRHSKRRLTHTSFLEKFFYILEKDKVIEFKTDNDLLFDYTLDIIEENKFKIHFQTCDLYGSNLNINDEIKTEYETKWLNLGANIKKVIFSK